jgi:hypothetical protein
MAEVNPGITNLESWWPQSADLTDSHGSNDLTNNGVTFGSGVGDYEYTESDYGTIADNASLSMGVDTAFTFGGIVNMESKTDPAAQVIMRKSGGGAADTEYGLIWLAGGGGADRFRAEIGDGAAATTVSANTLGSPSLSTNYLIIFWHDPDANQLGIEVNSGGADTAAWANGTFDGALAFTFGRDSNSANFYWDGTMRDCFYYKGRVLSSDEREWMYNSGSFRVYSELTGFIPKSSMF